VRRKTTAPINAEEPRIAPEKAYQIIRQHRGFILRALERLKSHHNKTMKVLGRPARTGMGYNHLKWRETS
jgi:hypothetical protein